MTRQRTLRAREHSDVGFRSRDFELDSLAWSVSVGAAFLVSAVTTLSPAFAVWVAAFALGALLLQRAIGAVLGMYGRRNYPGTIGELRSVVVSVLGVGIVGSVAIYLLGPEIGISRSASVVVPLFGFTCMAAVRYLGRLRRASGSKGDRELQPTLVYGAGWLGHHLVEVMRSDATSPYTAVGFIDDDPALLGSSVDGIRVVGKLTDLANVAKESGATAIVVSIARADGALLRRVSDLGAQLGLRVLVFPSLEEVLEGKSRLRDVRDIGIEDLIGRQPVNTDVESMAGYLKGKRILVTGAGGSIGSELCRQISKYAPEELIMLDRDETGLQGTQLLLEGHGLLTNNNIVLADIRDQDALDEVFRSRRPTVVFHAAALKHLPMLERFPEEAWKTNVLGTLNVLRAAQAVDVDTFVNISTDKAANATSVLGHSKRLAERLTAWAARETGKKYLSVRFGNVLGSRGSLVPVFAAMIEAGGPLTVTDRDVTRFFMSIPEACHLVVQAGGIGGPGEVLILDMGEPVRILDIAERMIARSGKDIAIVITGLREGEKLHEELVSDGELTHRPVHPKISHSSVSVLAPSELDAAAWKRTFESSAS